MTRRWGTVLIALAGLLGGGCAMLPESMTAPFKPAPAVAAPGAAASAPAAPAAPLPLKVEIEAPSAVRALLNKHLDVVRLAELARGEKVESVELDRLVAAAPAQARDLLETEGYFDPKVQASRDGDLLLLRVDPGPRANVDRLTLEVQGALADAAVDGDAEAKALVESWRRRWDLPVGSPFRNADWSGAKADALSRLNAAGYAAASFSGTAADVDTRQASVRLFVVADSGPLFLSGPIEIEGLKHQDAETVQHLAGFGPGTPLTETRLLDFQDRMRGAGLYDTVSVGFVPDPALAEATPVKVRVREADRQVWTLGLGVSANTGPRASVEHLHRRAFGWAATTRNKLEWGGLHQAWDGEISTHPGEKQYRWLLGGTLDRLEGDSDIVTSRSMRFGRVLNTPRVDRFAFIEIENASRRITEPGVAFPDSSESAVSANYHVVFRRLDDLLLPTEGYALSLQGGLGHASGSPGDSGIFSRAYGRLIGYWPLPGGWFGQARIELGQVFRPDTVPVPDSQQFRTGGDDSVRGYAYRSLGPLVDGIVDSGDVLLTTSVEVAHPIVASIPSLWGAVFVDAGRAAAHWSDLTPAAGIGVGVRWRSPVGALRLDLAWGEETRKLRMHFSVGVTY